MKNIILFIILICSFEAYAKFDEAAFVAKMNERASKLKFVDAEAWKKIQHERMIKEKLQKIEIEKAGKTTKVIAWKNNKILKKLSRKIGWIGGALIVLDAYCSFYNCQFENKKEKKDDPND